MDDRVMKLTDLKKLTLENQKLSEETLTLAWKNQASLEINAELYVAKLQAVNQKLSEEVLALTKRNNDLLQMQSELYKKAIEAKKSKDGYFLEPNHRHQEKSLDEFEKWFQYMKPEEHQLSEDRREQ